MSQNPNPRLNGVNRGSTGMRWSAVGSWRLRPDVSWLPVSPLGSGTDDASIGQERTQPYSSGPRTCGEHLGESEKDSRRCGTTRDSPGDDHIPDHPHKQQHEGSGERDAAASAGLCVRSVHRYLPPFEGEWIMVAMIARAPAWRGGVVRLLVLRSRPVLRRAP